jgi:radical SAM protein with 4Fe4S-binding SPASM domain
MPKTLLGFQWHITTRCGHRCQHCYMYDPATWPAEREDTLSMEELVRIMDRLAEFEQAWDAEIGHVAVSGGDPLLRPDWKEFIAELRRRGIHVSMMGNPETLTAQNIASLVELGVDQYQLSLDGLEATHDAFRRDPGTFQRTLRALTDLREAGISCNVMATLFPTNADELIPLLRFVAEETDATSFSFDVGVFVGNASELGQNFAPEDLQRFFRKYHAEKKRLAEAGNPIRVHEKSNLHRLTRFEQGEFYPVSCSDIGCAGGCLLGWTSMAILSDGTVLGCRRMPTSIVGRLPQQSVEEIWLGSPLLRTYRRRASFVGCGDCDFYQHCRGCPANVYSMTGDALAANPLCFRDLIARRTHEAEQLPANPAMDISNAEEHAWIASSLRNRFEADLDRHVADPEMQRVFLDLAYEPGETARFLADPHAYLAEAGAALTADQLVFLMDYFAERADGNEMPLEREDRMTEYVFNRMMQALFG